MACRQQTAPPQKRRRKDTTAHPHQPGARPEPPNPDPAHSRCHHPAKAKVKFPLRNRIFFEEGGGVRNGPGEARTILLLHIISVRPYKQSLMVRTFLKVYMELGSYFLFLQEQIKDIIIISNTSMLQQGMDTWADGHGVRHCGTSWCCHT
jgi:hypothetical protein